jgi:hypothetical protein
LTQVHTVDVTPAATVLEAALLETDEIKRLDPPYNVQLRDDDRSVWFASADLTRATAEPDDDHRLGPLPSRRALTSMAALRALARGSDLGDDHMRAAAVGVPPPFAPDPELFARAWNDFRAQHIGDGAKNAWHALLRASRRLAVTGVAEGTEDSPPEGWDLDRVRRHLDRCLLRGGQLIRRARRLVLLSDATIVFRERGQEGFRLLSFDRGQIVEQRDLPDVTAFIDLSQGPRRAGSTPWRTRQAAIDAAAYDRLRVLATELARVRAEGGALYIRIGDRLIGERGAARLISA